MAKPLPITEPELLKPVIEAMIFASEDPLPVRVLLRLLSGEGPEDKRQKNPPLIDMIERGGEIEEEAEVKDTKAKEEPNADAELNVDDENKVVEEPQEPSVTQKLVRELIEQLNDEYEETGRAFRILEIAGGFQFGTVREYGEYVGLLIRDKSRRRLSPAALETLSIIAYRQPVTKPEVEAIRGVNCDQVLLSLLERSLISIAGRSDAVGRPLLYGTTEEFLRSFGLHNLSDLPKLREIEELMDDEAFTAERMGVIMVADDSEAEEIEAQVGAAGKAHSADEVKEYEQTEGDGAEEIEDEIGSEDGEEDEQEPATAESDTEVMGVGDTEVPKEDSEAYVDNEMERAESVTAVTEEENGETAQ